MVRTEFYEITEDGTTLVRTYSDKGFRILQEQTGDIYDEAIDIENIGYTYVETDVKIDEDEEQPLDTDELTAEEALNIIMGRSDVDE